MQGNSAPGRLIELTQTQNGNAGWHDIRDRQPDRRDQDQARWDSRWDFGRDSRPPLARRSMVARACILWKSVIWARTVRIAAYSTAASSVKPSQRMKSGTISKG